LRIPLPTNLRTRLTFWYLAVLAALLIVYATLVLAFQYVVLTRQIVHDEIQDVVTVEGLLYFDSHGDLKLRQDYYSRPQSHLLVDRMMEVRDRYGDILYRSPTLNGMPLGGPNRRGEGDAGFDERIVRLRDGSHVFMVSHIHTMQGQTLIIRLGYSLAQLRARMVQFVLLLLVAVPVAFVVAGIAGQAIAKKALRPLEKMADCAESITAGNLSSRLDVANPNDELGHMARVFNSLLDRLEQAFAQLHRFTADAAHELRTPLAALRTIGEVALEKGQDSEEYREALGSILEETARLNETISSLLLLAKAETMQPGDQQTVFVASDLVDEILNLLQVITDERGITVIQEGKSAGQVGLCADRGLLRVAILNVLHNALKFSPSGATLRIAFLRSDVPVPLLRIAFQDQGPGIAPGEHHRVFERFFTSTARGTAQESGTGLGLSVAKLVIDRIGGEIKFSEETMAGAKCIITLPIWRGPPDKCEVSVGCCPSDRERRS
jgi:signal transduction histidine kinase